MGSTNTTLFGITDRIFLFTRFSFQIVLSLPSPTLIFVGGSAMMLKFISVLLICVVCVVRSFYGTEC